MDTMDLLLIIALNVTSPGGEGVHVLLRRTYQYIARLTQMRHQIEQIGDVPLSPSLTDFANDNIHEDEEI